MDELAELERLEAMDEDAMSDYQKDRLDELGMKLGFRGERS